ncbi:MAG TPA: SCO family protein [Propionicimonas sp.]|nr:SCO family protein [Propionicimonas sp.]
MRLRAASRRRLAGVGLALALLAGCTPAATVTVPTATSGYLGAELTTPYQLPDVALDDQTGKAFNLRTGSSAPVLVFFFGYTNCPDICLSTLTDLATATVRLPEDVRSRLQVVFITVDPHRDTPPVMAKYLSRIDPGFVGLTGPTATIEQVAASMGVVIEGIDEHHDGAYDVTHSAQVVGFDAARRGVVVWTQGTSISTYRADFERLVRQQG